MAEITAKMVGDLRQRTGAGMMDCKKALKETEGDLEKATEWLRQKGISSAEKKASKTAAEGLVGSYIHTGGRVGILVEINCQTDFVARNEAFQALVRNIAMQVAACPQVEYVKLADIPPEIAEKEKAIEMGRDDLSGKPDNIKEKIVQGRIEKRLKELCLLDQAYIRDQNITVEELVKQNVAQLGENIQVRRFVRFVLGEGIEKEEDTFVAEIAAQMSKMQTAAAEVQVPLQEPQAAVAEATEAEAAIVEQAQVDEVATESAVDAAIAPEDQVEIAEAAAEKAGKAAKEAAKSAKEAAEAAEEAKEAVKGTKGKKKK